MQIHAQDIEGVSVLRLEGSIEPRAQQELRERLLASLPPEGAPRVVVDLEELEAVDAAGLALLIGFGRTVEGRGGRLALCAPNPGVDLFLRISRVDRAFATFVDRSAALASF